MGRGFILEPSKRLTARLNVFPDTHLLRARRILQHHSEASDDQFLEARRQLEEEGSDSGEDDEDDGEALVIALSLLASHPNAAERDASRALLLKAATNLTNDAGIQCAAPTATPSSRRRVDGVEVDAMIRSGLSSKMPPRPHPPPRGPPRGTSKSSRERRGVVAHGLRGRGRRRVVHARSYRSATRAARRQAAARSLLSPPVRLDQRRLVCCPAAFVGQAKLASRARGTLSRPTAGLLPTGRRSDRTARRPRARSTRRARGAGGRTRASVVPRQAQRFVRRLEQTCRRRRHASHRRPGCCRPTSRPPTRSFARRQAICAAASARTPVAADSPQNQATLPPLRRRLPSTSEARRGFPRARRRPNGWKCAGAPSNCRRARSRAVPRYCNGERQRCTEEHRLVALGARSAGVLIRLREPFCVAPRVEARRRPAKSFATARGCMALTSPFVAGAASGGAASTTRRCAPDFTGGQADAAPVA